MVNDINAIAKTASDSSETTLENTTSSDLDALSAAIHAQPAHAWKPGLPSAIPLIYNGNPGYVVWKPQQSLMHREQARAEKRSVNAKLCKARTPIMSLCNELWAWTVNDYPGKVRVLAYIGGVERGTAGEWSKGARLPGVEAGTRLVAWIRAKARRLDAIADELERAISGVGKTGPRPGKATKARSEAEGLLGIRRSQVPETIAGGSVPAETAQAAVPVPQAAPYRVEAALPAGAQALGSGCEGQRPVPFLPPKA